MRSFFPALPIPRLLSHVAAHRAPARLACRAATALRPHAPALRLAALFALAFLLAFYLDARDEPRPPARPAVSAEPSAAPSTPAHRPPPRSAPLVERGRLEV